MKNKILLPVFLILILTIRCGSDTDSTDLYNDLDLSYNSGNFDELGLLTDSIRKNYPDSILLIRKTDSLLELSERVIIDFPYSSNEIKSDIERRLSRSITDDEIAAWENRGWLEYRYINGEKRYFDRAASNLMLLRMFYEDRKARSAAQSNDPNMLFRLKHTEQVINAAGNKVDPVLPVDMIITFTLTVAPDVVPDGEMIRCWLPWPKGNHIRQKPPELIHTSNPDYIIASDTVVHRSVYMEETAVKGSPVIFMVKYRYQSSARYFNPETIKNVPYDKTSYTYIKYTSEQLPQIHFSDNVRRLADSIAGPQDDPVTAVRKIYLWFKANIPWTGALEYSIMPDIPEYVIKNRRGDCGMQTLLFISMLRYKGIPARWQSGWMVPPGDEGLHDWCEVFFEGTGWVPVDISYNLQDSGDKKLREFYISGIDSYRMIINDGISGKFYPEKKYMRSDFYDFQRGEVEWKGGNIYYDKWDYDMEIEYLKRSGNE